MSKVAIDFLKYYRSEMGDRKFRKVAKEVQTAKRFDHLMRMSTKQLAMPKANVFFEYIMSSFKYSFARKSKLTAVALLLLERWDNEVNSIYKISSEVEVDINAQRIIDEGTKLGV
jgi:hypothetical protein